MKYFIMYGIVINIITFFIYGIDKWLAKKDKRRIRERTLFIYSFMGGFLGAILGMKVFHHKTKKIKFYIFNILAMIIWIGVIYEIRGFLT